MIPILSLLLVVTLSILVTRVATIALSHTGLSKESARFQARSAFTGAGFTTSESESVVGHPVRRRIVMLLMLLGNAGIVTAVSSLILTFIQSGDAASNLRDVVLLITGLVVLWSLSTSPWVDRHLSRVIDAALRRYTRLEVRDYASLMNLDEGYRLAELQLHRDDWLAARTLGETRLRDEGLVVLGIRREDGTYLGAPRRDTPLVAGDTLIVYGLMDQIQEIDERRHGRGGDEEHERAVREQRSRIEAEQDEDPVS